MSDTFPEFQVLANAQAVARVACARILEIAEEVIDERGEFNIVLAGGTTPEATYKLLADNDADWENWHIYFGDERCLPSDNEERNSLKAANALTDHVPIPAEQVHPIPAGHGAGSAASDYAKTISDVMPFDLVLLGMGEDGHTASLFPGHEHDASETVHAINNAPKPPDERVSMSARTLANTRECLILVTGEGKKEALRRWQAGEDLPVARIKATNTKLLLDATAWPES